MSLSQFLPSVITTKIARGFKLLETPTLWKIRTNSGCVATYTALSSPWLAGMNLATILDIGANVGQFAITAKAAFPNAMIYSFEPLEDCYDLLLKRMEGTPGFVAFNLGLGNESGILQFEKNASTPSSSFRRLSSLQSRVFPHTSSSSQVEVRVARLDDLKERLVLQDPILMKMDCQGYEDQVIAGGTATVARASVLIVETSYQEFYLGQPLFAEIYQTLTDMHFVYKGALSQIYDPVSGEILQEDSVFTR